MTFSKRNGIVASSGGIAIVALALAVAPVLDTPGGFSLEVVAAAVALIAVLVCMIAGVNTDSQPRGPNQPRG